MEIYASWVCCMSGQAAEWMFEESENKREEKRQRGHLLPLCAPGRGPREQLREMLWDLQFLDCDRNPLSTCNNLDTTSNACAASSI